MNVKDVYTGHRVIPARQKYFRDKTKVHQQRLFGSDSIPRPGKHAREEPGATSPSLTRWASHIVKVERKPVVNSTFNPQNIMLKRRNLKPMLILNYTQVTYNLRH